MILCNKGDLTKWATVAECLWLFLDYDGTLEEFAPTPYDVYPNPEIIQILEKLSTKSNLRVTVLSGRGLDHIRQLVPVQGIFLAGSYGIELLTPERELIHRVQFDDIRPVLETVKPYWSSLIHGRRGFFLEDKGWALAIHARFADEAEAVNVLQAARAVHGLKLASPHFRIVGGHKFLEIAPQLASKRETVEYLVQTHPLEGARLLYIGDDDKDEEAFPVIHAYDGVAVKVVQPSQVSEPSEADFYFEGPRETIRWLAELI